MTVVVRDLSIHLGHGVHRRAILDSVSLEVADGASLGVMGRSGIGKTTLLRAIAGEISPHRGSVQVELAKGGGGRSWVPQWDALLPWRTVYGNVALAGELSGSELSDRAVRRVLDLVGLSSSKGLRPHQISGGMARRLLLARALATEPELLLLDEPFASLDYYNREKMADLLRDVISQTSATVVLVTHEAEPALRVCDQVILLAGSPAGIVDRFEGLLGADRATRTQFLDQIRRRIVDG